MSAIVDFPRRIIPARAGFTAHPSQPRNIGPDHPRSRGVYSTVIVEMSVVPGSSPLARGLLLRNYLRDFPWGIIPARAGFTLRRPVVFPYSQDHPRSRGVYTNTTTTQESDMGSSPLARGLHLDGADGLVCGGIIPARAGFTYVSGTKDLGAADHPRSRGVYQAHVELLSAPHGSSPLARGLPSAPPCSAWSARIIPARAGFTDAMAASVIGSKDHPRSRGVYTYNCPNYVGELGSSPLARGLLLPPRQRLHQAGIIPARAGFTDDEVRRAYRGGDHPRSRGVYSGLANECRCAAGSSPLARGLR